MSNVTECLVRLHKPMDKRLLRALSLVLGFYHVAMIMWDPARYAESIGGFNALVSPMLIWAICSSMVFGLNFKPAHGLWQVLFSPYFCLTILSYLTLLRIL